MSEHDKKDLRDRQVKTFLRLQEALMTGQPDSTVGELAREISKISMKLQSEFIDEPTRPGHRYPPRGSAPRQTPPGAPQATPEEAAPVVVTARAGTNPEFATERRPLRDSAQDEWRNSEG